MSDRSDLASTLRRSRSGDRAALDVMAEAVYDELRDLAAGYLRRERADHTFQPTALAHEAFLRLMGQRALPREDRSHFLALAAQAMRRILTDHARRRNAAKRGSGALRVTLAAVDAEAAAAEFDMGALDDALHKLAALDERRARVVDLRFFGGLTIEETAEALGVSPATVKTDWAFARAWLHRELADEAP
ncbi:MAG: sigma-70 family RNA polymerase sigma factor [Candidatus Eisenbacteria bacterium]|uniref:Sigma-70 family RNA polymerase sigma factor n=1 Tax=Eiseniibacteriota bacterium TaxID=2212470 RepID=A0A933SAQ1_UNCEI|nr:sigma-70 family RNA polymerase sigma factor [Candidatus Eisenbacteria bacterium]